MLVNVNPKILVWAREDRFGQMPLEDVANKLNLEISCLTRWETDGIGVPFETLELIARNYKRQTAIFFLLNVPPKTKRIKDYRNIATDSGRFSPDTLLAIRRTERYLDIARELQNSTYWENQYQWIKNFTGKKENFIRETSYLRELLNSPLNGQINQPRSDVALRYWRSRIEEKLGIFIFQFSMPEDELDGFSYAIKAPPYAIVLNNQKAYVRRIFTLFHELSHIFRHSSGVCKPDHSSTENQFDIELECNSFAGEFLVPSQSVRNVDSVDEIFKLARLFSISGEVYLRRLYEDKKISADVFFNWLDEVRERSNMFPRKEKRGAPSMLIQSKSTRGNKLFNLVTNAAVTNQISYSTASDLLGLKVGSIGV